MKLNKLLQVRRVDVTRKGYKMTKWKVYWSGWSTKYDGKEVKLVASIQGEPLLAVVACVVDPVTEEVVISTGVQYVNTETGERS